MPAQTRGSKPVRFSDPISSDVEDSTSSNTRTTKLSKKLGKIVNRLPNPTPPPDGDNDTNDEDGGDHDSNELETPPASPTSKLSDGDSGGRNGKARKGSNGSPDSKTADIRGGKLTEELDPDSAYGKYNNKILSIAKRKTGAYTLLVLDFYGKAMVVPGAAFGLKGTPGEKKRVVEEYLAKKNCVNVEKTRQRIAQGLRVDRDVTFEVLNAASNRHGPRGEGGKGPLPECYWIGRDPKSGDMLGGDLDDLIQILDVDLSTAEEYLNRFFRKQRGLRKNDKTDVLRELRAHNAEQPTIYQRLTGIDRAQKTKERLEKFVRKHPEAAKKLLDADGKIGRLSEELKASKKTVATLEGALKKLSGSETE